MLSSTGDTSPQHILKRHFSELLGIIPDPDKLAVDLWSADLIPDSVKDNVLTTAGLSRFQKANKLVDEVYRSLEVFNKPDILVKFCEVLNTQHNPGLTRIADEILKQLLGEYIVCVYVYINIYFIDDYFHIIIVNIKRKSHVYIVFSHKYLDVYQD